ncbi:unnamed protein product [Onchocerca flexuosa]|uniref:Uncharacterized protein n=1 Tax=Onchocerca flexuosa TaxID=387005 RepID=A0A183H1X6_9BILA|nr:unnamed protein product [Onchocerca flexuosa]
MLDGWMDGAEIEAFQDDYGRCSHGMPKPFFHRSKVDRKRAADYFSPSPLHPTFSLVLPAFFLCLPNYPESIIKTKAASRFILFSVALPF